MTRQACREVPSQGAKLCRAGSGSLAPSKESKHGKREAVESEKHQQVRAGEAGASRSGIARRAWPAAGRPFCRPQLLLTAPGLGSPPAHCLAATPALGQPARPALGGPRCLCGKRRQDPAPQLLAWGAPGLPQTPGSRETKAEGQPGHTAGATLPVPKPCVGAASPSAQVSPRATSGHSHSQPGSSALFPERQGCGPWGQPRPQKGHERLGDPRKHGRQCQLRVPLPTPPPPPAPSLLALAFRARRVGAGAHGQDRVVSAVWCPG